MTPASAGKDTSAGATPASDDARHQLRQTHLYRLVDQYYLPFIENLLALERVSAAHVQRDPEDYLMFGRLGRLFRHLAIGGENRRQSGPRDNFGLESSHVIPALIRKCIEAGESGADELVSWGDGSPTREFLYAADAAEGLLLAAERYDGADPVNLGSGEEIAIRDLAPMVAEHCGFKGRIVWDASKPNGQPRRKLDTARAEQMFGFRAETSLSNGLAATIAWYRNNR